MMVQWSAEDQPYLVHFPEFPEQQFITHGNYRKAAIDGQEALEGLIDFSHDHHQSIPQPTFIPTLRVA